MQGEKGVIYRPLLTRHELYYDGSRKFYILFIESLPSKFLGKQHTSTLLAGLVLASRFRFAYFEEWDRMFTSKFGESLSDSEFGATLHNFFMTLSGWNMRPPNLGFWIPMN